MTEGWARLQSLIDMGGPVVALLAGASILALALVIWKAVVFEFDGIGRGARRGFLGATLTQTSEALRRGARRDELRDRVYARLETEFGRTAYGLKLLDLIAQIAPLLGLFGTVLGMIDAFRTLQEAGSSADPSLLAGGIWVALLTTAAGLVVAMPASILLGWFDARLLAHRRVAEEAVEDLLSPGVFEMATGGALAHA